MDTRNKPLTITIQPPITQHCTKCDYEEFYSFGSWLCNCPKCGEKSIQSGARIVEHPISLYKVRGSYYINDPHAKQWCYNFRNVPDKKKQYSFVIDEEIDFNGEDIDDIFEVASQIKDILEGYIYSGSVNDARALYKTLDNEELMEHQRDIQNQLKKQELEKELFKLNYYTGYYSSKNIDKGF